MEDLTNFDFRRILNSEESEIVNSEESEIVEFVKWEISAVLDESGDALITVTAGSQKCQIELNQQELLEVAFSLLNLVQTPVDTSVAYDLAETNVGGNKKAIKNTARILKKLRKDLLDS